MKLDEKTLALPVELDIDDEAAITAFCLAHRHAFEDAAHEMHLPLQVANEVCAVAAAEIHHHVTPLVDLYHAMYGEHGIIGRENPSALVLYVLAMSIDDPVGESSRISSSQDAESAESTERHQLGHTFMGGSEMTACARASSSASVSTLTSWDFSRGCGHRCVSSSGNFLASCGDASPQCSDGCNGMCGRGCTC